MDVEFVSSISSHDGDQTRNMLEKDSSQPRYSVALGRKTRFTSMRRKVSRQLLCAVLDVT